MSKGPVVGERGEYEAGVTRERASMAQGGRAKYFISNVKDGGRPLWMCRGRVF